MTNPRNRRIGFWIATALVAVANLLAASQYLMGADEVMANFARLGYPVYFTMILGVWKVLGSTALLVRKIPKATEWAYAGYTFVFTGAVVSHLAAGDGFDVVLPPLVMLGLLIGSYRLQPSRQT